MYCESVLFANGSLKRNVGKYLYILLEAIFKLNGLLFGRNMKIGDFLKVFILTNPDVVFKMVTSIFYHFVMIQ